MINSTAALPGRAWSTVRLMIDGWLSDKEGKNQTEYYVDDREL